MTDGIGTLVCVKDADGTVTVIEADTNPLIRVSRELVDNMDPQFVEPDGVLRFDSAGEYRYRFDREESADTLLYRRIVPVASDVDIPNGVPPWPAESEVHS